MIHTCWTKETHTAQKMKFFITDSFSKRDQICCFLRIWSHLLKKYLMENFIFVQCQFIIPWLPEKESWKMETSLQLQLSVKLWLIRIFGSHNWIKKVPVITKETLTEAEKEFTNIRTSRQDVGIFLLTCEISTYQQESDEAKTYDTDSMVRMAGKKNENFRVFHEFWRSFLN